MNIDTMTPFEAFHNWIFWREQEMPVKLQFGGGEFEARFIRLEGGNVRIKFQNKLGANQFVGFLHDNLGNSISYAGPLLVTDFMDFTHDHIQEILQKGSEDD